MRMNRILSVSLGSSRRDHATVEVFGGQQFLVERQGPMGIKPRRLQMIRQFDGKVAAFGLGGTDLYIYAVISVTHFASRRRSLKLPDCHPLLMQRH